MGSGSVGRRCSMRCPGQCGLVDVISFRAAISACKKDGQWPCVVPELNEMPSAGLAVERDQLRCGHFS
eukprot:10947094-Karenia_brevis.AAC.2